MVTPVLSQERRLTQIPGRRHTVPVTRYILVFYIASFYTERYTGSLLTVRSLPKLEQSLVMLRHSCQPRVDRD